MMGKGEKRGARASLGGKGGMYPRGRKLWRGLSDPVQLQRRRSAPGPQTKRNQPSTGLGREQMNEDTVETATSLFYLELVRALLSHKLSAPKSGPCPPSPSLSGASRTAGEMPKAL